MRNQIVIAVLVTLVTANIDATFAQRQSSRTRRNGMIWLFDPADQTMYRRIQEELNTNPSQMTLITALAHDLIEQTDNTNEAAKGDGPETPPRVSEAEAKRLQQEINLAGQAVLATILNKAQFARALEMTRQRQGYRAFEDPSFVKKLKLTTTQKKKIAAILRKSRLSDDDEDAISDVLKKEQHMAWLKLKGAPFKFPSRRGRGRNGSLPEDN